MCRDVFPDTPYAVAYGMSADERIRAAALATPPDRTWRWWSGNVSTTSDDYDLVGDYDESFREYGWEDIDWGYRLHLLGVPVVIPPGFTTLHHGPVTTTVERALRAYSSGAARHRFVAKHGEDALGEVERDVRSGPGSSRRSPLSPLTSRSLGPLLSPIGRSDTCLRGWRRRPWRCWCKALREQVRVSDQTVRMSWDRR